MASLFLEAAAVLRSRENWSGFKEGQKTLMVPFPGDVV